MSLALMVSRAASASAKAGPAASNFFKAMLLSACRGEEGGVNMCGGWGEHVWWVG